MLKITRVWQYRNEPNRIHYMLEGGSKRHLYADRGSALYTQLQARL